MRHIILILVFIFFSQFVISQKKVYLNFDNYSNEIYEYEIGNGKIGKSKVYNKEMKKNKVIHFYIKKELFKNLEIDTCVIDYLKNIKFSKIENLKNEVKKINPLYPYKVYPNLFLVEKINDTTIVKYKVKWEYYIE